jgi:hypothetical protein
MSPASCVRKCLVLGGLLATLPAAVFAHTNGLAASESSLSGLLRSDQTFAAAAIGPHGGFLVWQDNITDPSGLGISARRLDANLQAQGAPIFVNQSMGRDQQRPQITMLNDGSALVVYQSGVSRAQNVLARVLTAEGGFATGEILVNDATFQTTVRYTTNWTLIRNNRARSQRYSIREKIGAQHEFNAAPQAITLPDGSVVVAYTSSRVFTTNTFTLSESLRWDDRRAIFITNRVRVPVNVRADLMQDIYLQRLSASGQKLGGEQRVNHFADFNQREAALAALDNGNFVATWVSEQQRFENSVDVYARVFDGLGNPLTGDVLVNATNRACGTPAVAPLPGGGFTVAWAERAAFRSNGMDVLVRSFTASGAAAGSPVVANTFTYGDQFAPAIAAVGNQQVLVWSSMGQDGSWEGVFARSLTAGVPASEEFRVNLSRAFSQMQPRVVSDATGRALIFWSGYSPAAGFDINGRVYQAP